jgi:hypothetical protein
MGQINPRSKNPPTKIGNYAPFRNQVHRLSLTRVRLVSNGGGDSDSLCATRNAPESGLSPHAMGPKDALRPMAVHLHTKQGVSTSKRVNGTEINNS